MTPIRSLAMGVLFALVAPCPGNAQFDPAKTYQENPAVAARYPDPPVSYPTPAFTPGRTDFTSHAEMMTFLHGLQARAPGMTMKILGKSQQGRELPLLIFGTPAPEKPMVLLIGQQHGNEYAGGEAMLALAERIGAGDLAPLLDRITVLIVPRANPDGAANDKRVLANGIDLNRDHTLLRSPEGQALESVFRDYQPNVALDCHEFTVGARWIDKFGGLQRIDAMIQYATTANLPNEFIALQEMFHTRMLAALDRAGLTHDWYYTTGRSGGPPVVSMGGIGADTGRNVAGLHHAVSFLIETRGVGIGRAHLLRRVHTHVMAAEALLRTAAENPRDILAASAAARADVTAAAGKGDFVVLSKQTPERRTLIFVNPADGSDKPVDVAWNSALAIIPVLTRPRPAGYVIAASAQDAAHRLRSLGISVETITSPQQLDGDHYRVSSINESKKDDVTGEDSGAGKIIAGTFALEPGLIAVNAGDFYVSMAQPAANLAGIVLEPETPVGFTANRVIPIPESKVLSVARVRQQPSARAPFAD